MMWNWLSQLYNKNSQSKRKRVQIDIPIEQHRNHGMKIDMSRDRSAVDKNKQVK